MLGVQSGCLFQGSGQDPLERLLAGSTYTNGGSARYIHSLKLAIDAFIDREHPDVGETGLKVVPSLPNGQEGISLEELSLHCIKERLGGGISGEFHLKMKCKIEYMTCRRSISTSTDLACNGSGQKKRPGGAEEEVQR